MSGEQALLSILGVSFAAFCIVLTVRIVNRRHDDWVISAAWILGGGVIAIIVVVAATMLAAIGLHLYIHS